MKTLLKKIAVGVLLVLFMAVTFGSPLVQGFSLPENYDLVAILVEQGVARDATNYHPIKPYVCDNGKIVPSTLKSRIDCYAIDLQNTLPGTRTIVIEVDRFEKPENIRTVLQRLYFDGDPKEPTHSAYLKGVVVVGEVPLPVVKKGDNRFISMFPYTDLENSAYIYNQKNDDFELNPQVTEPKVELWHGVIRPPESTQTQTGRDQLAAYFDKNHLYHVGDPQYANFSRRLFFQDFYNEQKSIDPTAYKSYLAFLEHQDDISYYRYTKKLLQELTAMVNAEMQKTNDAASSARDALAASGVAFDSDVPKPDVELPAEPGEKVDAGAINDIQTLSGKMSDSLMKRYNEIFSKYPNLVNDFVRYTGRYLTPRGDDYTFEADSAVSLITTKDLYTMTYLRAVNDMIEKKIDEKVNRIQKDIPIMGVGVRVTSVHTKDGEIVNPDMVPALTLSTSTGADAMNTIISVGAPAVKAALNLGGAVGAGAALDEALDIIKDGLAAAGFHGPETQDAGSKRSYGVNYINYSPSVTINDLAYFPQLWPDYPLNDGAYGRTGFLPPSAQVTLPAHINGVTLPNLNSAQQCSLYLGSLGNGDLSKLVEANRALDMHTIEDFDRHAGYPGLTAIEKERGMTCDSDLNHGVCEAPEVFGGCFYDGTGLYTQPDARSGFKMCYPDHATDPVLDRAGTRQLNAAPFSGYDSYFACLNFRPEETLYKHRINIDQFMERLDDVHLHDDDDDTPDAYRRTVLNAVDSLKRDGLKLIDPDPLPDDQKLVVSESSPRFTLTLGDVLRGAGWDSAGDFAGWKMKLAGFLLSHAAQGEARVPVVNAVADQATIRFTQHIEKTISSVVTHKEPTKETLNEQQRSSVTSDLPVDQPRYVTFQNQGNAYESITYPDAFAAKNLEEYLNQLRAIEAVLNSQPKPDGVGGLICDNCLTSLISVREEQLADNPHETIVDRASQFKVADALAWKNMDIDSKHVYLSETFIDGSHSAFVDEAPHSYEIAYFNGEGDTKGYDLAFNRSLNPAPVTPIPEVPVVHSDDRGNRFAGDPPDDYEDGYLLFTWSPPPISPWWDRIIEWKDALDDKTDLSISFGEEKEKKDKEIAAENEKDAARKRELTEKEIRQPSLVDKIVRSRIAKVTFEADSATAVVGKKVDFTITVRDSDNLPVKDEFNKVTLTSDVAVTIVNDDDDPTAEGTQIPVIDGKATVSFVAPDDPARIVFTAKVDGSDELSSRAQFTIVKEAQLVLSAASTAVVADGRAEIPVAVSAVDASGNVLTDVNGKVRIGLSDETLGSVQKVINLRQGRGQLLLKGGTKRGEITLYATLSNLNPGTLTVKLLPGPAVKLALTKDSENLEASPDEFMTLSSQIFDANNNLIDTNTGTQVAFSLSAGSEEYAQLSAASAPTAQGIASVRLLPKGKSGTVHVTAHVAGLRDATLDVDVVRKFGTSSLSRMVPESLVAALLGIPAGNVAVKDGFGASFLFAGKTQAVATLTTSPKQYGKVFEVNDRGVLTTDDSRVAVSFVPANHLTFLLRDTRYGLDLAKIAVVPKKDGRFEVTTESDPEKLSDGIYIRQIATEPEYQIDTKRGALRVVKDAQERIEVQTNGYVKVLDQDFTLRPKAGAYLALEVLDGNKVVAEVSLVQRFSQDVRMWSGTAEVSNDAPGIYVQQYSLPSNYFFTPTFTGNTTAANQGLSLLDRSDEKSGNGSPGFGYNSFEDSLSQPGVGFTRDNKFALLFAGGETFGEANRHYMSDAAIVLGDPTVRLGDTPRNGQDYSNDLGSMIYSGESTVKGILPFDVNADSFEDILIFYENGEVHYLQNKHGVQNFEDRGVILNIKNGIQDYTKVDINNDGQMDLAIAAKEGCKVDETCVDIFVNNRGVFTRQNLSFDQKEAITTLKAADVNNDRRVDLVMVDTSGDVSLLYQTAQGFIGSKEVIGNVGLKTDPAKNLVQSVLIRYAGMPNKDPRSPDTAQYYQPIAITEQNTEAVQETQSALAGLGGASVSFDSSGATKEVQKDFVYADAPFSALRFSTKTAQDMNGDVLRNGDRVHYTITLQNSGASAVSRVSVSDVIAQQLILDNGSIRCLECAPNELQLINLKGDPQRPFLFSGLNVPANGRRTITYDAVFSQSSESAEKVLLDIRADFTDSNPTLSQRLRVDALPDISITTAGNPTGSVQYLVSKNKRQNGTVEYENATSTPPPPDADSLAAATDNPLLGASIPPSDADEAAATEKAAQALSDFTSNDSDGDGIQDAIDKVNGELKKVGDVMQNALNKVTCDAGCIALPVNAAYLAPGFFSLMGTPGSFDVGTPAIGWGIPSPVAVDSGKAGLAGLGGRFYLSPTLTGGLGFGLCLGPYGTPKNCYAFGISPLDLLPGNICDTINGGIQKGLSKAASVVNKAKGKLTAALHADKPSGRGGTGLLNYSFGSYEPPVGKPKNIRVPGFPGFITDWWASQIEEIIDKATDLPDLYVIYPKLESVLGSVVPTQQFGRTGDPLTNVLSYINSIPLVNIESSEVTFKVPIITAAEIEKLKADAYQWVEDERLELDSWKQRFGCFIPDRDVDNPDPNQNPQFLNLEVCNFVDVNMNALINTVIENVKRLDEWKNFPKKVLQWRTAKTYYMNQVLEYLDTVIEFMGGWIQRNTTIVKQWRKSIREMREVIEHYKLLVKIMIEANSSCDQCKTERYGLDELILKLFAAIPKPPVIPLPKLPDIVVDVSKIQAGVTVQWPDVHFAPEPFIFPKLPRIHLGLTLDIPKFKLMAPPIPLIPQPPELPNLPSLPPLQLGSLPDLPPPPKLPPLPGPLTATIDILRQLLRIYCIIKLGLTPTDELLLKTRIEQITARGLTPVLPIDLQFAFPGPSFSVTYVDRIVITAFLTLNADMSFIQKAVEQYADKANKFTNDFVNKINKYTENLSKTVEKYTSPQFNFKVDEDGNTSGTVNGKKINREDNFIPALKNIFGPKVNSVADASVELDAIFKNLSKANDEYKEKIAAIPSRYVLTSEPLTVKQAQEISKAQSHEAQTLADAVDTLPIFNDLITYREALGAYTNNEAAAPDSLRELVAEATPLPDSPYKKYLASTTTPRVSSEPQKLAALLPAADSEKLLAQVPDLPDPNAPGNGGPNGTGSIDHDGLFYNDSEGNGRRLINYTLEQKDENHLESLDADNDGDDDTVFSYGKNVYIKANHMAAERRQPVRMVFDGDHIEYWTIYALLKDVSAPRDVKVVSESAHTSTVQFAVPEVTRKNIVGFDVTTRPSINAFDQADERASAYIARYIQAPVQSNPAQSLDKNAPIATITSGNGLIKVSNKPAEVGRALRRGERVEVGESSKATITFTDGTVLTADENASFELPDGDTFTLLSGDTTLTTPENATYFAPSTTIEVSEGTMKVVMRGGTEVELSTGTQFALPALENPSTVLTRVTGSAQIEGSKREYITSRTGPYHLNAGDKLHPISTARVIWAKGSNAEREYRMQNSMLSVADSQADGLDIEVLDGQFEVIKVNEKGTATVTSGTVLLPEEKVTPENGAVVVDSRVGTLTDDEFNNDDARRVILRAGQSLSVHELESLESLSLTMNLDQRFYVGRIKSLLADGTASVSSGNVLMAPQACGDRSLPLANAGASEMTVTVGKEVTIDASRSTDADGIITQYILDTDLSTDSNNDGDTENDGDKVQDFNHPLFTLPPFTEVGDVKIKLTVKDESHNAGTQTITIHVVKATIVLDPGPLKDNIITGHVEPPEPNVPISIARLRASGGSGWQLIKTPSANENGQYLTDANGVFKIDDAKKDSGLMLFNDEDKGIAYVNRQTGRITILDDRYELHVLPANASGAPTRMAVFLKGDPVDGRPYTYSYLVPDVNTDVSIDGSDKAYTLKGANGMSGVHVKPLTDKVKFEQVPATDDKTPGAVIAKNGQGKQIALFNVNGDVFLQDSSLALRVKEVEKAKDSQEPVVYELTFRNQLAAELLMAVNLTALAPEQAAVVKAPQVATRTRPKNVKEQPFIDVPKDDPFNETLKKLYARGIVAGYKTSTPGEAEYRPDQNIARSEFTQITMKMLCIVPSEEAKRLPTPFYDVVDPRLWFYPVLKEGNIRGFIKGYLGEGRRDPRTGKLLTPFKAANPITRAEATTVVLAALDEQGIIDLSKADLRPRFGDQWYDPYLRVAVDLTPYLVNPQDAATRPFLLTRDEALRATELITRRDFAGMAERVLLMRDCGNPDQDHDGMDDAWEQANQATNPDDDLDKDSCPNKREFEMGTDPRDPDTDHGGTTDCVELARGSDPRGNPVDDKRTNEGIFVVEQGCSNVCPCRSRLEDAGDVGPEDIIFAAISGPNGVPIYAKSNEEKYRGTR